MNEAQEKFAEFVNVLAETCLDFAKSERENAENLRLIATRDANAFAAADAIKATGRAEAYEIVASSLRKGAIVA